MEIKEHLYFKSQKITISGVLSYIIRSNSLYTYITSNSFSIPNTGDPLKKKTKWLVKAGKTEKDKMADALEEKTVDLKKKKKMAGALEEKEEKRKTKEKEIMKKEGEEEKKMGTKKKENEELEAKSEPNPILETHSLAES